jgi:plastocyanin
MLKRTSVLLLTLAGAGLLIDCGSTTPAGPGGSTGSTDLVIITITGINGSNSFAPASASLKAGQSVAWKNSDTVTHRPILSDVFDTKQLAAGATSATTVMSTPGTYEYKCTIHPEMTGTVVVTP